MPRFRKDEEITYINNCYVQGADVDFTLILRWDGQEEIIPISAFG